MINELYHHPARKGDLPLYVDKHSYFKDIKMGEKITLEKGGGETHIYLIELINTVVFDGCLVVEAPNDMGQRDFISHKRQIYVKKIK